METVYDWVALAIFAAIVVLFLHRSIEAGDDSGPGLVHYLVPSVGCAVFNYLGNEAMALPAVGVLALTLVYIARFLRPFPGVAG